MNQSSMCPPKSLRTSKAENDSKGPITQYVNKNKRDTRVVNSPQYKPVAISSCGMGSQSCLGVGGHRSPAVACWASLGH